MTPDRNELMSQAYELLNRGGYSREDSSKVEGLLKMVDLATSDDSKASLRSATHARHAAELGRPAPGKPDHVFEAYLRFGRDALPAADRAKIGSEKALPNIRSAQAVGTTSAGGALVPQSMSDSVFVAMQQYDEIVHLAQLFETPTGSPNCPYPILDDIGNPASIISENAASSELDTVFSSLVFPQCPMWRAGYIAVANELLADSKFDVSALISAAFGIRFARGIGAAMMTKLLAAAGAGVVCASTTAPTGDELITLISSLDAAYLNSNTAFLMLRSTYTYFLSLKGSGSGDYLFKPILDSSGRPTLLGYPVYFSPSAGALSAGAQPILFGDMSRMVLRKVTDSLTIKVLTQLGALNGQVLYLGFLRADSGLLKVSGAPVPVMAMAMHA